MPDTREKQIETAKALLEDGAEAERHAVASQIVTFRERAVHARAWGWVFLAAIVLSLMGGLALFWFALKIAQFDTARQLAPKAEEIARQRETVVQKREQIRGDLGELLTPFGGAFGWKQTRKPGPPQTPIHAVSFADAKRGWAVGKHGLILATSDGGRNWTEQRSGGAWLRGAAFADAERGWAVGGDGLILATSDGGRNWTEQRSGGPRLWDVALADAKRGWAVGDDGLILATSDGGRNWTEQRSGVPTLFGVAFADAERGWAVGDDGLILATGDGGRNWARLDKTSDLELRAVHAAEGGPSIGVGERGIVLTGTSLPDVPELGSDITTRPRFEQIMEWFDRYAVLAELFPEAKLQIQTLKGDWDSGNDLLRRLDESQQNIELQSKVGAKDLWNDPTFITSNLTRVGAVVIILFLVQVLISLYRYNMRLAAYYEARADALILTKVLGTPVVDIVGHLTPDNVDFGKTPAPSSGGHATEIWKALAQIAVKR